MFVNDFLTLLGSADGAVTHRDRGQRTGTDGSRSLGDQTDGSRELTEVRSQKSEVGKGKGPRNRDQRSAVELTEVGCRQLQRAKDRRTELTDVGASEIGGRQ